MSKKQFDLMTRVAQGDNTAYNTKCNTSAGLKLHEYDEAECLLKAIGNLETAKKIHDLADIARKKYRERTARAHTIGAIIFSITSSLVVLSCLPGKDKNIIHAGLLFVISNMTVPVWTLLQKERK